MFMYSENRHTTRAFLNTKCGIIRPTARFERSSHTCEYIHTERHRDKKGRWLIEATSFSSGVTRVNPSKSLNLSFRDLNSVFTFLFILLIWESREEMSYVEVLFVCLSVRLLQQIYCLAYSSSMKMEPYVPPKRRAVCEIQGLTTQKTVFLATAVRIPKSTKENV
jgi:hypothetical protein